MAIRWVGVVQNPSDYQRGMVPPDAQAVHMPAGIGDMMRAAFPFSLPALSILLLSMVLKTALCRAVVIDAIGIAVGVLAGFFLLPVHELLHAAVYPRAATVSIGIMPKQFAAVALASYPLSRRRFIWMSLLPLILGIVPLIGFLIASPGYRTLNGILFGMAAMGMVSPYPDLFHVFMILRQAPPGALLQYCGNDLFYYQASDRIRESEITT